MDPITIIVTALAVGAAAGLKSTTETVIKDAYSSIKALIKRKYQRVNIDMLESDPASKSRQTVVKEDLEKTDAGKDKEVLSLAKALLEAIKKHAPEAAKVVGVKIEDVEAASMKIDDIISTGDGVSLTKTKINNDLEIKNVRAGISHP